ncbi:MAG: peptide deformylase [Ignavibacteria bacterium]|nr:peptide deformylase [Ignavibacteria bacterium]
MSVLPIYLYGTDVLREKARQVEDLNPETIKLIVDLFETMEKAHGVGLAATQVGVLKRVIVVDITGVDDDGEETSPVNRSDREPSMPQRLVLINPEVIEEENAWTMEEGCLSIPDVRADVERSEKITVRYRDGDFKETLLTTDGLLARVILHEIDHLDGILFVDHISGAKRALLRGKLRAIKKGEIEVGYPVVSYAEV